MMTVRIIAMTNEYPAFTQTLSETLLRALGS